MKKRISLNEWLYIGKYHSAAKWIRPLCSHFLVKTEKGFRRDCYVNLFIYILLVIPAHIIKVFYYMWDGGLKEFEFEGRFVGSDNIWEKGENQNAFLKAKEIWEKG